MGCHPVVVAGQRSELSDPGLARRPALVGVEVGDGVVQIHPTGAAGGVGEHIDRLPQPQMLPDDVGDFVGVDRRWHIVQVDDRLQQDLGRSPTRSRSRVSSTGPMSSTRAIPRPADSAASERCT